MANTDQVILQNFYNQLAKIFMQRSDWQGYKITATVKKREKKCK